MQHKLEQSKGKETKSISIKRIVAGMENEMVNKATDWVTELNPCAYTMYGCTKCEVYPMKANGWYRTVKMAMSTPLGTVVPNNVVPKRSWGRT